MRQQVRDKNSTNFFRFRSNLKKNSEVSQRLVLLMTIGLEGFSVRFQTESRVFHT